MSLVAQVEGSVFYVDGGGNGSGVAIISVTFGEGC